MLRSKQQQQQQKIPTKPRGIQPSPRRAYTRTEGARPPGGAGEWPCLAGGAVGLRPGTGEDLGGKCGQWVWGGGGGLWYLSSLPFPTLLPRRGVPRVGQPLRRSGQPRPERAGAVRAGSLSLIPGLQPGLLECAASAISCPASRPRFQLPTQRADRAPELWGTPCSAPLV